jgi:hypothetical protein
MGGAEGWMAFQFTVDAEDDGVGPEIDVESLKEVEMSWRIKKSNSNSPSCVEHLRYQAAVG